MDAGRIKLRVKKNKENIAGNPPSNKGINPSAAR